MPAMRTIPDSYAKPGTSLVWSWNTSTLSLRPGNSVTKEMLLHIYRVPIIVEIFIKCCCSFNFWRKKNPWNFHTVTAFVHFCWKKQNMSVIVIWWNCQATVLEFYNNSFPVEEEFPHILIHCLNVGIFKCFLLFRIQTKLIILIIKYAWKRNIAFWTLWCRIMGKYHLQIHAKGIMVRNVFFQKSCRNSKMDNMWWCQARTISYEYPKTDCLFHILTLSYNGYIMRECFIFGCKKFNDKQHQPIKT